jgi:membrane-associated phospholipid phosphatase
MKALADFRVHFKSAGIYLLFAYILIGLGLAIVFDKGTLELWVNKHHNVLFDYFFKYVTLFGDGWLYLLLGLGFLVYRYAWFLYLLLTVVTQTVFVQIPKRVIFPDEKRPAAFFDGIDLHFVEGVKVHTSFSFPSGHSATAFAIATLLILVFPRLKKLHVVVAILAVLAAFSRIYLMQHFIEDTIVGGTLGIISAWLAFFATRHLFSRFSFKQGLFFGYSRL